MVPGHDSANTSASLRATSFSLRSAIDGETEASQQTFEITHNCFGLWLLRESAGNECHKLISQIKMSKTH